ncbi:DUF3667 domain-containing protein [Croceiramulus getboli]|nr:DUF3667 domain-containing protein [Flavobacteriaceae bacterium YJPT1-3]
MEHKNLPTTGRKAIQHRGVQCLNCGHPLELSDRYCSYCGQLNTTKRLSLGDFAQEFISSVFTYDSRFRYTVKDLLLKPGTITRYYVDGKRLRYANPFRFFLSVSIIYFLISSTLLYFDPATNETAADFSRGLADGMMNNAKTKQDSAAIAALKDLEKKEINYGPGTLQINPEKATEYTLIPQEELDTLNWFVASKKKYDLFSDFYEVTEISNARVALDSLQLPKTMYNVWLYERNESVERIQEDPVAFLTYVTSKIPFFLFFFAPIFALFFPLFYYERRPFKEVLEKVRSTDHRWWKSLYELPYIGIVFQYVAATLGYLFKVRRKCTYMEHLIFIFHIFTFVFLALLIIELPSQLLKLDFLTGILFGIIGPFYFYKALRNFYKQNRFLTLFKFFALNFVFFTTALITGTLFFVLTAAAY